MVDKGARGFEVVRRGVHSLHYGQNALVKNLISEQEDVAKAYSSLARQSTESLEYLARWADNSIPDDSVRHALLQYSRGEYADQYVALMRDFAEKNQQHCNIYRELFEFAERATAADKKLGNLEKKTQSAYERKMKAKFKRDFPPLNEAIALAKEERENASDTYLGYVSDKVLPSIRELTENAASMHARSLEIIQKRLAAIALIAAPSNCNFDCSSSFEKVSCIRSVFTAGALSEKYEKTLSVLGKGASSVVYSGHDKSTGKAVAIKVIKKKKVSKVVLDALYGEITVSKKLFHSNIVQLLDAYDGESEITLVMESMLGGHLLSHIEKQPNHTFSETEARKVFHQVCSAVHYLHSQGVVHRDLKPENFVCSTEKGELWKISDFGLAKELHPEASKLRSLCGTPSYLAAEVVSGREYGIEIDIWSLGVVLYVLLSGVFPFSGSTQEILFKNIRSGKFDFEHPSWRSISDEPKKLIASMLQLDPTNRPSAGECLSSPWVAGH